MLGILRSDYNIRPMLGAEVAFSWLFFFLSFFFLQIKDASEVIVSYIDNAQGFHAKGGGGGISKYERENLSLLVLKRMIHHWMCPSQ